MKTEKQQPLVEKISSLETSLLDVTKKSYTRVDELNSEITKLKASKSEVNEAIIFAKWLNKDE